MKLIKEYLISADKYLNRTLPIRGYDGEFIKLDLDLDAEELATQIATIEFIPLKKEKQWKYDTELNRGDIVLCHFHVIREKNEIIIDDNVYYRCLYVNLWAKIVDEKIVPLEDYIFVEPIIEDKSELFCGQFQVKMHQEDVKSTGFVFALSNQAKEVGINEGDKVFVTQNAECEINIMGKRLWRMRIRNIVGIERNNGLICLKNKILVKELPTEKPKSLWENIDENKKERFGQVVLTKIKGLLMTDKISYHNGVDSRLVYRNEVYAYINKDNLNYVLNGTN